MPKGRGPNGLGLKVKAGLKPHNTELNDNRRNSMKEPEELGWWNFSDTEMIPDGYDMKSIPKLTQDNFQTLIAEHNNLVEVVNAIREKLVIDIDFDT